MKRWKSIGILALAAVLAVCLIRHEQKQAQTISSMQEQITSLHQALVTATEAIQDVQRTIQDSNVTVAYAEEGYNYLAIGNSVTRHLPNEDWWSDAGMAASTPDHDYFHLVTEAIREAHPDEEVCSFAVNLVQWEHQANDRAETYIHIDPYLSSRLDLVTIQLGENAEDLTTYRQDLSELIRHIRGTSPESRIVVIDDVWYGDAHSSDRRLAAEENGCAFVDLEEIRDNPEYIAGMGQLVYGRNGAEHVIEHEGVAKHPNDLGMEAIAEGILNVCGIPVPWSSSGK